jgi:hypothetical protein
MFVAIVIVYFNILKISNMQKAPVVDAWLVGGCVGGSLVTYLLNHDVQLGPVGAAATVGTVAGMIPARYLPSGNDFRLAVYCGAFVGMSSQQVINGYLPAILAGLLCGCVYLMATGTLVGYGGKLGTIAFAGVNMCSVVIHLLRLWNL